MTAPGIPAADRARIYAADNAGKTVMYVKFADGAAQPFASQVGVRFDPGFTTALRPTAFSAGAGANYFDSTLNKPAWSTGSAWVDATATV